MSQAATRRRVAYGPARQQVADLWLPAGVAAPPVVVLVHGGYWRAPYTKRLMGAVARDVVARGWAAWNVEYRRTGFGGGGGGWPDTMDDVAHAVDRLAEEPAVDVRRVALVGHSAGGQLALWAAGRYRLPRHHLGSATAGEAPAVGLVGVVSAAGVVDLEAAASGGGAQPLRQLLGDDSERRRAASPLCLVPIGVPQALVHGTADATVPLSMSQRYATRAAQAGDDVVLLQVPCAGHRDVLAPSSAMWLAVAEQLERWFSADADR